MYIMQFIFWFYIYYGYYVEVTVVPFIDTVSSLWILYLLVAKEKKKGNISGRKRVTQYVPTKGGKE